MLNTQQYLIDMNEPKVGTGCTKPAYFCSHSRLAVTYTIWLCSQTWANDNHAMYACVSYSVSQFQTNYLIFIQDLEANINNYVKNLIQHFKCMCKGTFRLAVCVDICFLH